MMDNYIVSSIINKEIGYHVKISEYTQLSYASNEIGITSNLYCKEEIIISLTTYSKRIYDVHLVIESLFNQTFKANKIILWLAENEFNIHNIPSILSKMQDRGLIINFYADLRSYKKMIPTLLYYSGSTIITVDDDVIYPRDLIERFIKGHIENPNMILFGRGHQMTFSEDGKLKPYREWKFDINEETITKLNFPTGIGGILYPVGSLNSEVTNDKLFMRLAPYGDDIWFKVMSLLNGIQVKKIHIPFKFDQYYTIIRRSQDISLYHINRGKNENDKQIKDTFDYFNLWEMLYK